MTSGTTHGNSPAPAPFPALASEHAFRHKLAGDGRESATHQFVLPQYGIAGFLYPTVRAGGHGKARLFLFGPGIGTPIEETVEATVDEAMDFDDWRLSSVQMSVREAFKTIDLAWQGQRIQFNGRWEAIHPPYAFGFHPKGNPPWYGDNRTEQHGVCKGELVVDGKSYPLDDYMIRDHSWGPRVWGLNQHYKWFHATTASCSVHFFEMHAFGRVELRGYVWKDGAMAHVSAVDYVMDYDETMMHKAISVTVTDSLGRAVYVESEAFANYQLDLDPVVLLNEAVTSVRIAGERGTGWCEFCWNRDYLAFAKPYVERFGR